MVHFFSLIGQAFAAEKLFFTIHQNLPAMPEGDQLVLALGVKDYSSLRGLASGLITYTEEKAQAQLFSGRSVVLQAPDIAQQFRIVIEGRGRGQTGLTAWLENYRAVASK